MVVERVRGEEADPLRLPLFRGSDRDPLRLLLLRGSEDREEGGLGGLGEGHEMLDGCDEIAGEEDVPWFGLVGDDIMEHSDRAARRCVTTDEACDSAETRGHEREPVHENELIGLEAGYMACRTNPRERINRRDEAGDGEISRRRAIGILRLSREEERRVLEGEGDDMDLVSLLDELMREALGEGGDAAAVWPGWAEENYVHIR